MQKCCSVCRVSKPLADFYRKQSLCKECDRVRSRDSFRAKPPKTQKEKQHRNQVMRSWETKQRINPARRSYVIYRDSIASDRIKSRSSDLTVVFIESLISKGCAYCEAVDIKMTLDRIDNSIGHVQGNVVPACVRCNYMRRDMPYEAWLEIAKSVKVAREKGLFGGWIGAARTVSYMDSGE